MPRITRAALRSIEQQYQSDLSASTPLPQTPIKGRVPLGETAGNRNSKAKAANISEVVVPAAKKGTGKGKKGSTAEKAEKQTRKKAEEFGTEVLEDETQSTYSGAAEVACQDLMKDGFQEPVGTPQVVIGNDPPHTPPSAAANTTSPPLSPKHITPYFDSEVQKPDDMTTPEGNDGKEDSFVAKIETRTPLKRTNSEGVEEPKKEESDEDDLFVEQIKTRTPSKRISRIEDSVDALDALEEEIEMVGELIPASTNSLRAPAKVKKQAKHHSTAVDQKASDFVRAKRSTGVEKDIGTGRPSTTVRKSTSHSLAGATSKKARPSTSLAQAKTNIATQAPGSTRNVGQPTPQTVLKKRISSVHKAPFQPIKSTKPPTRATFELPGVAVARKLKEQREERLKREEDETPKPRVFKARPARLSHAPEVKLTAATKARLSMAKGELVNRTRSSNGYGTSKPVSRPSPATASPNKRFSTLSAVKSSAQPTTNASTKPGVDGSARTTRGPLLSASTTIRALSALGANRPAPTTEESAHQKLKGKEVFGRTKVVIMEREKAKKVKEDAARKARADAAERGRIASREWAEKQKAKKSAVGDVTEEAKAVGA